MTEPLREPLRRRRTMTASAIAQRLGISARTVRRYQAEARADYLARAAARQTKARALRQEGKSWAQVGEVLQLSPDGARKLASRGVMKP